METDVWKTHDWAQQPLEIDPGKKTVQFVCRRCGRGFVSEVTGKRYAVRTSGFKLHRLADEITSRWLSEPCLRERLPGDPQDKKIRFANELSSRVPSPNREIQDKLTERRSARLK